MYSSQSPKGHEIKQTTVDSTPLRRDTYPLPRIDDLLDSLKEKKHFSYWTSEVDSGNYPWPSRTERKPPSPPKEEPTNSKLCPHQRSSNLPSNLPKTHWLNLRGSEVELMLRFYRRLSGCNPVIPRTPNGAPRGLGLPMTGQTHVEERKMLYRENRARIPRTSDYQDRPPYLPRKDW